MLALSQAQAKRRVITLSSFLNDQFYLGKSGKKAGKRSKKVVEEKKEEGL